MASVFGAEFRKIENREYLGKAALVAVAARTYDTTVDDLWEAITTPERLERWFTSVEGDFKVGGRYHIKGNASGTITRCERPRALELTWEIMGGTSWVNVQLEAVEKSARLTIEHIAHTGGIGEEHMNRFGPGAVGIGWDLSLHGLGWHLLKPTAPRDQAAIDAWTKSDEGKAFMRGSGEAWGVAHAASGEDPEEARAKAERTIAAYTGG